MTNEQAKDILEKYLALDSDLDSDYIQAQKVAIKALEQVSQEKSTVSQGFSQDDCISRRDVLRIIDEWYNDNREVENIEDLIIKVTYTPSVTPIHKVEKWVPVKTRPLDDEEKEYYSDQYDFPDIADMFMYDCKLPEDGQEVLITTWYDNVTLTTFYADEGCYFESYEESDDVKAWMSLPEPYKTESEGRE